MSDSDQAPSYRIHNAPHVILLTETPNLQGAFPLVLHLAQASSSQTEPGLIVDLSPAASRLTHFLKAKASRFSHWYEKIQPWWADQTQGRTLNTWQRGEAVDLLAQVGNEFPTASQMPRLCEQVVRHLAQPRVQADGTPTPYRQVFLLSEYAGVPLDLAAWHAADEIWILHDSKHSVEQVAAHLAARITVGSHHSGQRIVLLNKVVPKLSSWPQRRRVEPAPHSSSVFTAHWPHLEAYNLSWPLLSGRLVQSLARTARDLDRVLIRDRSGLQADRQAS